MVIAPPGLAFCPNCGGHGHTGECESEPGKLYDCYVCGNSGFVPEACAAEWNSDLDAQAELETERRTGREEDFCEEEFFED